MALAVALAAGCGGAHRSATLDHLTMVPEESTFVLGFEIAQLERTKLWSQIGVKMISATIGDSSRKQVEALKSRCNIDPVHDLRWIVYAVPAKGDVDSGVLLVNGAWDRNKFERCVGLLNGRDRSARRAPEHNRRGADELALFSQEAAPAAAAPAIGSDDEDDTSGPFTRYGDTWVGWAGPDTAAVAFKHRALPFLRKVLANHGGSSVLQNPAIARMLQRVAPDAILWAAGVGESLEDADPLSSDVLKHAAAAFLSITLAKELDFQFVAEQALGEDAEKGAKYLRKRIGSKLEGVPMIDRLQVTAVGAEIRVAAHLDAAALDTVATLVGSEADREIARAHADDDRPIAEPTAAPPPPPPPPSDRDSDGIPDSVDRCPDQPEDKDGFEDDDGCPDPDNDRDGLVDARDKCPNEPETKNGYQDEDGCPDAIPQAQLDAAKADAEKRANSRTDQGIAYLNAGVFDKALEEFTGAYKLVPAPLLLFDIALTYDKMKDRANALDNYKRYVDADPAGMKAKDARKRIAELTKDLAKKPR